MNKKAEANYWSMTEGVFNCLIDAKRTSAFKNAIENSVKPGDIVVDMGTGTGVLAMFAAKMGAKKVYAIENDPKNVMTLHKTFKLNGYNNIVVIEGDVTKINLPEKVDVIIGEMIATALIEELQVPAMNNILRFSKKNTRVVLNKFESYLDLVSSNNEYYGYKFDIIRYEYPDENQLKCYPHSDKILYSSVDFSKKTVKKKINLKYDIKINKNGTINALRLSSKTIFIDKTNFDYSFAYSYPIVLPIESIDVKIADKVSVSISYTLCGGWNSLKYNVKKNV
jgi:predicted RNA methylase